MIPYTEKHFNVINKSSKESVKLRPYEEAILTLYNGNHYDFKTWLKGASKLNMLNAIEYAMQEGMFKRHQIINSMRSILES